MDEKYYELVFSGTVVAITQPTASSFKATFEVERVWKGSVPKRFDLYYWTNPEIPQFKVGDHYLALARKIVTPLERDRVGLGGTDTVAFTPAQCSDPASLSRLILRDLGPGKPPK
jgi:hypothetical protein